MAGEERAKTFDILLTRPIERWRILLEKALAIFLGVVIITAATTIGAVAGAKQPPWWRPPWSWPGTC